MVSCLVYGLNSWTSHSSLPFLLEKFKHNVQVYTYVKLLDRWQLSNVYWYQMVSRMSLSGITNDFQARQTQEPLTK